MERRKFIGRTMAGGALLGGALSATAPKSAYAAQSNYMMFTDDLYIERAQPGKPHKGKVLAAIQAHGDDIPIFCAGTVAKLIKEGYTGYLIRTTNEDTSGRGTVGEGAVDCERDGPEIAKALGLKKAIDLNYRKHRMDGEAILEIKARFIFLFRALKIDTVFFFDPWDHYEENPDHYTTAQAVDAACWHSGGGKDYPEHMQIGIESHGVNERYYYARGPQLVNRVVDVSPVIDIKVESNLMNKGFGPAGNNGVRLRERLAKENKRLTILGDDDHTANFQYVKQFQLEDEKKLGKMFGLEYAEAFHYVGPGFGLCAGGAHQPMMPTLDKYIEDHSVPIR